MILKIGKGSSMPQVIKYGEIDFLDLNSNLEQLYPMWDNGFALPTPNLTLEDMKPNPKKEYIKVISLKYLYSVETEYEDDLSIFGFTLKCVSQNEFGLTKIWERK